MDEDTSLIPEAVKAIIKDYKNSFVLIFTNKWLYSIPLFLVLSKTAEQNLLMLSEKLIFPDLYRQRLFFAYILRPIRQPFLVRLVSALHPIQLASVLSSLSILVIFNLLGALIVCLFFYKKFKDLSYFPFIKKLSFYLVISILFGFITGLLSFFLLKNLIAIFFGALIFLTALAVLLLILFTIVEGVFLSYIKSLLVNELIPIEIVFNRSGDFFKPLFMFNLVLTFASSTFFANVIYLPDFLNRFLFGKSGIFVSSIPHIIYMGAFSLVTYFNALFAIIFVFAPFIISMNSSRSLFTAVRENAVLIKRRLDYYLLLVLSGALFLIFLRLTLESVNLPSIVYLGYDLLFTFFIIMFFITTFRCVINYYQKSDHSEVINSSP